jgi:hypothetical protein
MGTFGATLVASAARAAASGGRTRLIVLIIVDVFPGLLRRDDPVLLLLD